MSHAPTHPTPTNPPHQTGSPALRAGSITGSESRGTNHGHAHPDFLAHHWETPQQQFEAGKLGMWLFLATEVLLFGGLFCAYAIWRGNHPELFKYGSGFLDTTMGATNTVVLILSSLTMAWGVTCAQRNQQLGLKICLILTLLGAATFMVIKYFEYTHKFHEGYFPGMKFYDRPAHSDMYNPAIPPRAPAPVIATPAAAPQDPAGAANQAAPSTPQRDNSTQRPSPPAEQSSVLPAQRGPSGLADRAPITVETIRITESPHVATVHPLNDPNRPSNAHMFFNIYFMMTGLHGIHVLIGMIVITWLLVKSIKGHFSSEYFTPVDLGGLYWHIVDLIWIFLFPLFYLI